MKLKFLMLAAFLTVGSAMSYASTVACAPTTLDQLVLLGSGGCEIADKVYSNFSYSGFAGDPSAAQISVGVDNQVGIYQTGLQFGTTAGVWTTANFTVSYTVTVDPAQCVAIYGVGDTCTVGAAQLAFQGALAGGSNTAGLTATFSGATPGSVSVNDLSVGNNVNQVTFSPNWSSSNVVITGTGNTISFPIDSFGLDIYQTVSSGTVPEPATLSMMGAGLLGLGLIRRKLKK